MSNQSIPVPSQAPKPDQQWQGEASKIVFQYLSSKAEISQAKHCMVSAMMFAFDSDMGKLIDPDVACWLSNLYNMLHRMEQQAV